MQQLQSRFDVLGERRRESPVLEERGGDEQRALAGAAGVEREPVRLRLGVNAIDQLEERDAVPEERADDGELELGQRARGNRSWSAHNLSPI